MNDVQFSIKGRMPLAIWRRSRVRHSLLGRLLGQWPSAIGLLGILSIILLAILGPFFSPYDPSAIGFASLEPPSIEHLMGTDRAGRDVFARFLSGSRVSLQVASVAVATGFVIGTAVGIIAGRLAGTVWETVLMRSMDVIIAFPFLILVPVVTGVFATRGYSVAGVTFGPISLVSAAIGFVMIPVFARIARSGVLGEMKEDYVLAATASGASGGRLMVRHVLPNILPPLVVQAAFGIATAIAVEAAVSFLGLGIQPPDASWGTLLNDGRPYITLGVWWLTAFPAFAIAFTVLSINLVGDQLREELDPRSQSSRPDDPGETPEGSHDEYAEV